MALVRLFACICAISGVVGMATADDTYLKEVNTTTSLRAAISEGVPHIIVKEHLRLQHDDLLENVALSSEPTVMQANNISSIRVRTTVFTVGHVCT